VCSSDLSVGIEAFRRWGIEPPPGSWIRKAANRLDQVVARNSLGESHDELRETSAAIAVAVDLYHIGLSLAAESNRQVAAELSALSHGRLLGRQGSAAGGDYLSQFWIGTLLAQSRLQPRVITNDRPDTSKPDFIISCRRVDFAVEVKRPRSSRSAVRAVKTAAKQLRDFNGPGIIVVDATDSISSDPWGVTGTVATTRDRVRGELESLHKVLGEMIEARSRPGSFVQVAMLMTFARFWSWTVDEAAGPARDAGLHFHARGFRYTWSNQMTNVTEQIQHALLDGLELLTGNRPTYQFFR